MDFLARAGSSLERAHRLAGVLLGVIFVLIAILFYFVKANSEIKVEYERLRNELKVYVVPGSISGIYQPTQPDMLLREFSSFVVQSLSTYTFANIESQYKEARSFFVKDLRKVTDQAFKSKILQVRNDEQSSIFIEDRDSFKVETLGDGRNLDETVYQVTMRGLSQYIIGGSVVEAVPVRIQMKLLPAFIGKDNPFGFVLKEYKATEIEKTPS
ncbi:MAG: hypothetical protein VX730_04510 [Pseudomonadota bacterium]|nr:hypothetical protein [Pseudomonadota bacterium]